MIGAQVYEVQTWDPSDREWGEAEYLEAYSPLEAAESFSFPNDDARKVRVMLRARGGEVSGVWLFEVRRKWRAVRIEP